MSSPAPFSSPLLLIPLLIAAATALVPVTSPDELIYKLAVPHAWQQFGAMIELPLSSHSYTTLAPHATDLASLVLSGGIAAKLARFALYVAALIALFRLGARFSPHAAWIVAIIAWTPALAVTAGWCWDEWALIGLFALSLERWLAFKESADHANLAIVFAALGAAVATKYTALPWAGAFAVVLFLHARVRTPALHLRGLLVVLALGGLFYVRNTIWTGSPIAPLMQRGAPPVLDYRSSESFGGWRELVSGAYIFDRGMIDESLGILLPLGALVSLFAFRRRDMRDLLIAGWIQVPILLTLSPIAHNLAPALTPLAVAGGALLVELGVAWRVFASLALALQCVVITFVLETYDLDAYLGGRLNAAEYVRSRFEFAQPFDWIHANTPANARVLVLGETRTFYLDRQFIAGGNFDGPRIAGWLASMPTAASMHTELRRLGITHLLLSGKMYRVRSADSRPLTLIEREQILEVPPDVHARLVEFARTYATQKYQSGAYAVFELR